jgi:hypothetical protein
VICQGLTAYRAKWGSGDVALQGTCVLKLCAPVCRLAEPLVLHAASPQNFVAAGHSFGHFPGRGRTDARCGQLSGSPVPKRAPRVRRRPVNLVLPWGRDRGPVRRRAREKGAGKAQSGLPRRTARPALLLCSRRYSYWTASHSRAVPSATMKCCCLSSRGPELHPAARHRNHRDVHRPPSTTSFNYPVC